MAERLLTKPHYRQVAAQAKKNRGSAHEALGEFKKSKEAYASALRLEPDLGEAHFALAHWHRIHSKDLRKSLKHLDSISVTMGSALSMAAVEGWRVELYFLLGDYKSAFRTVNSLTGSKEAHAYGWEWGSSARLVAEHGRKTNFTARQAYSFWRRFLEHHPREPQAMAEEFLCAWHLHHEKQKIALTFDEFCELGLRLVQAHALEEAFILDKIGHWAQDDGNWEVAAHWFQQAYTKNSSIYGCCLGEALNRLGRHEKALVVLLRHVRKHRADAVAWFKTGYAYDKLGMTGKAARAFSIAVKFDENYEAAWFNLGGMLWNLGNDMEGLYIWHQAIRRFPKSAQSRKLLKAFPILKVPKKM